MLNSAASLWRFYWESQVKQSLTCLVPSLPSSEKQITGETVSPSMGQCCDYTPVRCFHPAPKTNNSFQWIKSRDPKSTTSLKPSAPRVLASAVLVSLQHPQQTHFQRLREGAESRRVKKIQTGTNAELFFLQGCKTRMTISNLAGDRLLSEPLMTFWAAVLVLRKQRGTNATGKLPLLGLQSDPVFPQVEIWAARCLHFRIATINALGKWHCCTINII